MARSIAQSYEDKGALIITVSDDAIRIGTAGLIAQEIRDALCYAMHYAIEMENKQ